MVRWINKYIGTAARNNISEDGEFKILDVRNLVDKEGNNLDEIANKIREGVTLLESTDKLVVCCDFGMSRSNSIAAGIISMKDNIDFYTAVELVMAKTGEKEIKISMLESVESSLKGSHTNLANEEKILVTGATGFLGRRLVELYTDNDESGKYIFLSSGQFDLVEDVVSLNLFCKKNNVKTIVHLASPRIYTTLISFGQTLIMLKNILDICVQSQIKLIFASTWEVFSGYKTSMMYVNESVKLNPGGTYGQSKMLSENLIQHYIEQYGVQVLMLRFSPIYGLGSDKPKSIWNFSEKALKGIEINTHLYQNGLPSLDLLHIDDACSAIFKAVSSSSLGAFNISSGEGITTKDLAEQIVKIFDSQSAVVHTKLDLKTSNIVFDTSKANKVLGWYPSKPLAEGLEEIANFIKKNNLSLPN